MAHRKHNAGRSADDDDFMLALMGLFDAADDGRADDAHVEDAGSVGPYPSKEEAEAAPGADEHCNPRLVFADVLGRKKPSRAQLVEHLAQQFPGGLLRPGPAQLLLGVTAHLNDRDGAEAVGGLKGSASSANPTAWIGRRSIAAFAKREKLGTGTY